MTRQGPPLRKIHFLGLVLPDCILTGSHCRRAAKPYWLYYGPISIILGFVVTPSKRRPSLLLRRPSFFPPKPNVSLALLSFLPSFLRTRTAFNFLSPTSRVESCSNSFVFLLSFLSFPFSNSSRRYSIPVEKFSRATDRLLPRRTRYPNWTKRATRRVISPREHELPVAFFDAPDNEHSVIGLANWTTNNYRRK